MSRDGLSSLEEGNKEASIASRDWRRTVGCCRSSANSEKTAGIELAFSLSKSVRSVFELFQVKKAPLLLVRQRVNRKEGNLRPDQAEVLRCESVSVQTIDFRRIVLP